MIEEKLITDTSLNSPSTIMPQLTLVNPSFVLNDSSSNNFNSNTHIYTHPLITSTLHNDPLIHLNNNHHLINTHHNSHTNVSLLNSNLHNFNESFSKSMPSTPTHGTNLNNVAKVNSNYPSQNLHVNFNISPSKNLNTDPNLVNKKYNNYLD